MNSTKVQILGHLQALGTDSLQKVIISSAGVFNDDSLEEITISCCRPRKARAGLQLYSQGGEEHRVVRVSTCLKEFRKIP